MVDDPQDVHEHRPEPRRGGLTPVSLFVVLVVFYLLVQVRIVVVLLLVSILFATVLQGPVERMQRRGMPRSAAILMIYLLIVLALVAFGFLVFPPITNETLAFWEEAPVLIGNLAEEWRTSDTSFLSTTGYRVLAQLQFRIENPPPPTGNTAIGLVSNVGGFIFGTVAMFVIAFYYLMEKRLFRRLILRAFSRQNRPRVNALWDNAEEKVGGWLRGQLLLMLIIGVLAGLGYYLIDVRFWLLLAVVAGVTEVIPILGPWIGGIPAVIFALVDSWEKALIVGVFLILLQFAENSILVPRIMRGTIGLTPLTVFLAVLAGGVFAGVLGALIALPVAAAVQVIVQDLMHERDREPGEEVELQLSSSFGDWGNVVTRFLRADDKNGWRRSRPAVDPRESTPESDLGQPKESSDELDS